MKKLKIEDFPDLLAEQNKESRDLEFEFTKDMQKIYSSARGDLGYISTRFLISLYKSGGRKTAKEMLQSKTNNSIVEKFIANQRRSEEGVEKYTVEYLIFNNDKYHKLFDANEIKICEERLKKWSNLYRSKIKK